MWGPSLFRWSTCCMCQYSYYTVRITHILHIIKTQHVKNRALVLLYLNTMYDPWYCCHPTQTQYHHELRDTVIAQKGLPVAQTQLRLWVLFPLSPPTIICTNTAKLWALNANFHLVWLHCKDYILLAVFANRTKAENILYKHCDKNVIPFAADLAVREKGGQSH